MKERVWRIKPEISGFCLDGNGSIYCSTGHQVNIYLPNGVTVLVEDLECVKGIAVDGNNNVHISASSSIQVFNPEGQLICEYRDNILRVHVIYYPW